MHYLTQDEIVTLKKLCAIKEYLKDFKIHDGSLIKGSGLMDLAMRVCVYYDITFDQFTSIRRDKNLVDARTDFCHLAKKRTRHGCNQIGRFMNRDHTSVLYHWKKKPVCMDDIELKMNGGEDNESEDK